MYACKCVGICRWASEVNLKCHYIIQDLLIVFCRQGLSWLAGESQGPIYLHLLNTGTRMRHQPASYMGAWGEAQVPMPSWDVLFLQFVLL